ncbi:hypothetical protein RhiirB3_457514, partial [Rhizophagus irregularis]
MVKFTETDGKYLPKLMVKFTETDGKYLPKLMVKFTKTDALLATPPDNHYCFYTDGSLINLGTSDVSMGWSWVQVLDGAGFFQSIAAHAHGIIHNWPSSTRAEIATIHAALTVTPPSSTVTIYTDSQSAID